jgi:protein involved in polysaccharide export with SLBB domain
MEKFNTPRSWRLWAHVLPGAAILSLGALPALAQDAAPPAPKSDTSGPTPIAVSPRYRVEPGDVLAVTVQGKPELSKISSVQPDGTIQCPYIGLVKVAGLDMSQVLNVLTQKFSKEVRNPSLTVDVVGRRIKEVSILGSGIRNEGQRRLGDQWYVFDLIANSGGLAVPAEWTDAKIIRRNGDAVKVIAIDLSHPEDPHQNVLLEEGDQLQIDVLDRSKTHVLVSGAVAAPNLYPLQKDRSLLTLISQAGGVTPLASLTRAVIKRSNGQEIPVDLTPLYQEGAISTVDIKLEPGDTVVIPANKRFYSLQGAINRTGEVPYPEDREMTVLTALNAAGGPAPGAELKKAYLIHVNPDRSTTQTLINLETLLKNKDAKAAEKQDVALKAGDALYIEWKNPPKDRMTLRDVVNFIPFVGMFMR